MIKWAKKEAAIRSLERGGKVDPLDLIDAAKDSSHPCHGEFTWDVKQAAKERWRDQARKLIRRCTFEVTVEDVTSPVVQYIAHPAADIDMFVSVPKLRGKAQVTAMMLTEVNMLLGLASRIHGVALAKQGILGPAVAGQLASIVDLTKILKEEMEE